MKQVLQFFFTPEEIKSLRHIGATVYDCLDENKPLTSAPEERVLRSTCRAWRGLNMDNVLVFLAYCFPEYKRELEAILLKTEKATGKKLFAMRSFYRQCTIGTPSATPWHCDAVAASSPWDCITMWVPLDPVGDDLPSLEFQDGPVKLDPGDVVMFDAFEQHRTQQIHATRYRTSCEFRLMP